METDRKTRLAVLVAAIIFFVFAGKLWLLQIIQHSTYRALSLENSSRTIPLIAPRGIIYDRQGKVLVSNRAIFSAYLFPGSLGADDIDKVLGKLSKLLMIPKMQIVAKIEEKKRRPFEPVLVKDNISINTVTALEEQKNRLPGVVINTRPVRYYPHAGMAAHVLGYVGKITSNELRILRLRGYRIDDFVGKEGVESVYDGYLRGVNGGKQLEIDVYGRPIRTVGSLDPIPGKDLRLTIDLELQKVVENTLSGLRGSVIVMNPRNGEILALSSSPSYAPNIFTAPLDKATWQRMDKEGHPFLNRALSVYPPGSIFKAITLSSTLQENNFELGEIITCTGSFELGNRIAGCWREDGHGDIGLLEGLVWSCDVVFYKLGLANGPDLMSKYARKYGLGQQTGIDLTGELPGFVPTASWKKRTYGIPWVKGDSINMAIGQGFLEVTPIQMANLYGIIAVGKRYVPHVLKEVFSRDGEIIYAYEPKDIGDIPIGEENHKKLKATLVQVVERGTGIAANVEGIPAAGKTGTAENPKKPHAWFICYAPVDDPQIVIASFVEEGEHGDSVTAHIARKVLTWYRDNRLEITPVSTEEASS
ncbi:penicillin-binding protein 2 [Candidatus Margulisiibacteriota bacterium]